MDNIGELITSIKITLISTTEVDNFREDINFAVGMCYSMMLAGLILDVFQEVRGNDSINDENAGMEFSVSAFFLLRIYNGCI